MVKKLIGVALGTGMLLATVAPAFAAVECGNQTTGASSINLCTRILQKTKSLSLLNSGTVGHLISKSSVSGYNASNYNTQGGTVAAGAADVTVGSAASLNTASVAVNQSDPTGDETGLNNITGYASNNQVSIQTIKTIGLGVNNTGSISHVVSGSPVSGYNSASYNTNGGSVTTGGATATSDVTSILNDTFIEITQ